MKKIISLLFVGTIFVLGCQSSIDSGPKIPDTPWNEPRIDTVDCAGIDKLPTNNNEFYIGFVAPFAGDLGSAGSDRLASVKLAVQEANARQQEIEFKIEIVDSESNPKKAREGIEKLSCQGVKAVVGPGNSANCWEAMVPATYLGMTLICPSSTAAGMNSAGENLCRLTTPDTRQGPVLSEYMVNNSYKPCQTAIRLYRNDVWANRLRDAMNVSPIKPNFFDLRYETGLGDFKGQIDMLASIKRVLTERDKGDGLCAVILGFDEIITMFDELSAYRDADGNAVDWSSLGWYTADGFAQNGDLLENTNAVQFAADVGLVASIFVSPDDTAKFDRYAADLEENFGVSAPNIYAAHYYDAANIYINQALEDKAKGKPFESRDWISRVPATAAALPNSVSGDYKFDENCDRAEDRYGFYQVEKEADEFTWNRIK